MGGEGKRPFTVEMSEEARVSLISGVPHDRDFPSSTNSAVAEDPQNACIFFDLDGTWFRWQLFDEWIKAMIREGLFPEIVYLLSEEARLAYQNREGKFSEWMKQQVEAYSIYLQGVRVDHARFVAHKVIQERGKRVHVFTRGLSEAAAMVGYQRAIISGSPQAVVHAFAEANGISIFLGTEHEELDGEYTGVTLKEWVNNKTLAVLHLAELHNIELSASVAIGDSYGDHLMLEKVGFPICFNPEKRLRNLALERGWLIVVEKKDCLHIYRRQDGVDKIVKLDEYLPQPLAEQLSELLMA